MFYLLIQFRISYIWFKSLFHNFFKQVVLSLFFRKTTKIISYRMVLTIVINIEVIGFLNGSVVKSIHLPMQETWVQSLGQEDVLERKMTTHFSILA